ncbi:MAG: DNA cytosine methyltransferase [Oscillospiraceae bacterium]|nr:DNA cytosine methyltransferase [Oscillospiraceae bacterium]
MSIKFIDLFCGIGGIRLAMEHQGFQCVMSCDIDEECRKTYNENFHEMPQGDITKIEETSIPDHDILCAGFPCQPFSISGKQRGFDDTRGTLFFDICRILNEKKPPVVFLENVKHLVHHNNGKTLSTIIDKLEALGYCVEWKVLNGADFGVPQNRERIIIIGSLKGKFDFEKIKTVPRGRLLDYLDAEGDFEYLDPSEYTLLEQTKQQPGSGLIFAGYRNKSIRKVGVRPGTMHLSRVHKQPNRIYSVMGIHPTLPSQETSGRYFILTEDNRVRKLTLNECWRIMGFPEDYKKVSAVGEQYKQLGNSVCVPMIEAVAEELDNQFFGRKRAMTHEEVLRRIYEISAEKAASNNFDYDLPSDIVETISSLVENSERNKGVITVLITLFSHKIVDPAQDIRYHQAKLDGGFAGRVIDTAEITPFLKSVSFPAMAESGWLTRSLEQSHPYTLDYPGAIAPKSVKTMFLNIIDQVQVQGISAEKVLICFFTLLIKQRDALQIELAKPHSLSIAKIITVLERHFTYHYTGSGASRLPTLAVYAAYQCMITQVSRYNGKVLCPLESHNSADAQSGRIGDIDVNNADGSAFEGVEIKHEIPITRQLVADAYEKFKVHNTDRYYLLTTANMDIADWDGIEAEIQRISQIHGCQVIVNGVYSTLKYYLRLLEDPAEFVDRYVELLKVDESIKFQHKTAWNDIISAGV